MALIRRQQSDLYGTSDPLEEYGGVWAGVELPEVGDLSSPKIATTAPVAQLSEVGGSRPRPPETPPIGVPVPRPDPESAPVPVPVPEVPPASVDDPDWYWGIGAGSSKTHEKALYEAIKGLNPTEGLTSTALSRITSAFPGATSAGGSSGQVRIPSYGLVDVIRNAGDPSAQWWWGLIEPEVAAVPSGGGEAQAAPAQAAPAQAAPAGAGIDIGSLLDLLGAGETYAGPGSPGVFEESPVQQVGQDPLSLLVSGGLVNLLEALSEPGQAEQMLLERGSAGDELPEDLQAKFNALQAQLGAPGEAERLLLERGVASNALPETLQAKFDALLAKLGVPSEAERLLLERGVAGDVLPKDLQAKFDALQAQLGVPGEAERLLLERGQSDVIPPGVLQRRMESVRENAERVRKAETDTLRAALADRGLISVPGAPQGAEWTGLQRISDALASQQYTALRDISTDLMEQYAQQALTALQSAAAAGSTRAGQALSTLSAETEARNGRAGEALDALAAAATAGNARAQNTLSTLATETEAYSDRAREALDALTAAAATGNARAQDILSTLATETEARGVRAGESLDALTTAAAAGNARAQNILSTLAETTDRQETLTSLALRELEDNMAWNKFLAEFGLNRDQVMEELRAGRLANVMAIITQFYQAANISRGGYV